MNESQLEVYWNQIPTEKDRAISYDELCEIWGKGKREVRKILHELSLYDNGDNLILIRSSQATGFYRTSDRHDIGQYRGECLNRGKRTFAPLRKIDRVLQAESGQLSFENNLRAMRVACNKTQQEVCQQMKKVDPTFDSIMLSKMENNRCLPTPIQLAQLAFIYGCTPHELVDINLYSA